MPIIIGIFIIIPRTTNYFIGTYSRRWNRRWNRSVLDFLHTWRRYLRDKITWLSIWLHKEGKLFSSVELYTSRVKRRVNGVISAEASVTRHAPQMRFLIALISLQSRLRRYSDFAETSTFREKTACPSRTPDNAEMNIPTILFMSPVRTLLFDTVTSFVSVGDNSKLIYKYY